MFGNTVRVLFQRRFVISIKFWPELLKSAFCVQSISVHMVCLCTHFHDDKRPQQSVRVLRRRGRVPQAAFAKPLAQDDGPLTGQ